MTASTQPDDHRAFGEGCRGEFQTYDARSARVDEAELETLRAGYQALEARSNGRYSAFLREAARCTSCSRDPAIPRHKQPIPFLCGRADLSEAGVEALERANAALDQYRHTNGTLCVDPNDGNSRAAVQEFLDEHGLAGLSIGHCGWGDMTARLRGADLDRGVGLMVLGADWYPLAKCSNFLMARYNESDATIANFVKLLGTTHGFSRQFFIQYRVYLGNTLLCYRNGYDATGSDNLSGRSFERCRPHLSRHIAAIGPEVVVTLGAEPCRSVAGVVHAQGGADRVLRMLEAKDASLRRTMEAWYANSPVRGIPVVLRETGHPFRFVPLYHPSYSHINKYAGDYESLRNLLREMSTQVGARPRACRYSRRRA